MSIVSGLPLSLALLPSQGSESPSVTSLIPVPDTTLLTAAGGLKSVLLQCDPQQQQAEESGL